MGWVQGLSVRILTHESARIGHRPIIEAIRESAQAYGLMTVRVTRGIAGWTLSGGFRTADWVDVSNDLPVVIEIVDCATKIEAILPNIMALGAHHMIAITEAQLFNADRAD